MVIAEIISVVLILLSFELIGRKLKIGFITMMVGQLLATIVSFQVGLHYIALMHFVIIITNIRGYKKWKNDEKNFHHH